MGEQPYPLINDGRLAARIMINDKIRELLNTVVIGLEQSNRHKLKQLTSLAKDTISVRKMLSKRSVADFLNSLYDHSLINSCESYVLTPPFRIKTRDLDIRTLSGNIENLIKHIRINVLQPPSGNLWKANIKAQKELETILQVKITPSSNVKAEKPQISNTGSNSSKTSSRFEMRTKKEPANRVREEDEEKLITKPGRINFIARNIEAAAKVKKIEYDSEEDDDIIAPKRLSTDSTQKPKRRSLEPRSNIQSLLPTTESRVKESVVEDESKMEKSEAIAPSESILSDIKGAKRKSSHSGSHDMRSYIKHTTCPACMAKWKTPLPSPKTPRVKDSRVLPGEETPKLQTNLHNRISMLINKEMYKLESYDRRYSTDSEASKKFSMKKKNTEYDPLDNVYLDPMDLARIEQEIKEKETKKKLEKFLKD